MRFTIVVAAAVLAHATQSLAAPVPVSYDVQRLVTRGDDEKEEQNISQGVGKVLEKASNVPLKSGWGTEFQTGFKALNRPPAPRFGLSTPSQHPRMPPPPPHFQPQSQ